ncbi:MAG: hypothetical protein SF029_15125 [bacterium]|nr:hypothetical protein [bacterium]
MPFVVEMLVDEKVVLIEVSGATHLPEIQLGGKRAYELMSAGEAPVHVVIDVTEMTSFPLEVSSLYEASPFYQHPSLGFVVACGITNALVRTILRLFAQMAGFRYHMAETVEEALIFLRTQDATLPPPQDTPE